MKPEIVNLDDYQKLVVTYHDESDRAAIVLAGSFVEHYLAGYIKNFMIDDPAIDSLFDQFGPFASFDQRISAGYAFKLIPKEMKEDLVQIKHIRNHFAHTPRQTTLDDPKIAHRFSKLSTAKNPGFNADGTGPLTNKKMIYLFAVASFVVFAHNSMLKYPKKKENGA